MKNTLKIFIALFALYTTHISHSSSELMKEHVNEGMNPNGYFIYLKQIPGNRIIFAVTNPYRSYSMIEIYTKNKLVSRKYSGKIFYDEIDILIKEYSVSNEKDFSLEKTKNLFFNAEVICYPTYLISNFSIYNLRGSNFSGHLVLCAPRDKINFNI